MISASQSGNNLVIVSDKTVNINGKVSEIPRHVYKKGCNTTVIDGKVYINGYEFRNGKWKITLKSIWHLIF
jgi:hypothetical protein